MTEAQRTQFRDAVSHFGVRWDTDAVAFVEKARDAVASVLAKHHAATGEWALYYMGTNNTWDPKRGTHPNCTLKVDPNQGSRASRRLP